jgi:hypothetical protein
VKEKIAMVLLAAAAGCGTSKGALLEAHAAADFHCGEAQLSRSAVWPYVERVQGCGRDNVYLWDFAAKNWVSPLDRAAFEFSCPKEGMKTVYLSNQTVGVEGCGKKAVYSLALSPPQWILNSNTERQ